VPNLLAKDYHVTVYDTLWYGNFLPKHPNLEVCLADIRDIDAFKVCVEGHDAVVHLACISNDASFELDEKLSTSINYDAFEPLVVASKEAGVKRFIYASSSSVYGVSEAKDVTEDHPLVPLTLYNKYKGLCEPILKSHTTKDFVGVVFRPATVCGYSPRQRLDLSVNVLTSHAVNRGKITVFGGTQMRPNLHIQDYCRAVLFLLRSSDSEIANETFNVGGENMSLADLGGVVADVVSSRMRFDPLYETVPSSDDQRSYHINSDKIARVLEFRPAFTVSAAINELVSAFEEGKLPDPFNDIYHNMRRLKRLQVH